MRTKFAIALAIVAVCLTAAWAGWNDAFQVTDNELENRTEGRPAHNVVIGADGDVANVVHMVWQAEDDVYYKRYFPGDGWSGELKLGDGAGYQPHPAIALDPNGTDIHVVWMSKRTSGRGRNKIEDMTVYYRKCVVTGPGNGGWDENPTDLCVTAVNGYTRGDPCVACGASGQVVVAWMEDHNSPPLSYSIRFREYAGGWQDEEVIAGPSDVFHMRPSIAADGSGDVFVTYTLSSLADDVRQLFVTRRINGDWTDPDNLTPEDDLFWHSMIAVSPETHSPHLVCWSWKIDGTEDLNLYHTYLNDQGDWEDLEVVSDPAAEYVWGPRMFFTSDGLAHVVWGLRDTDLVTLAIMYASCPYEGGTWTNPVELVTNDANSVDRPDIAGGTDGTLFAIWQRSEIVIKKIRGKLVEVTEQQIWGMYNTPEGGGEQARPVASSQLGVELVPNPAKAGRVAVRYSLPRAGQMTVTLVDISGRVVQTQEVAASLAGAVGIDVSGLTAGVYVARLVAGDLDVSQPLVIAR